MTNTNTKKIREYLKVVLETWRMKAPGNISFDDIYDALKTDTLKGYSELIDQMYEDGNFKEAEHLQELVDEAEAIEEKKVESK